MRIAVVGSRDWNDRDLLFDRLTAIRSSLELWEGGSHRWEVLVSGGARGADQMAVEWAWQNAIQQEVYRPEYNKYPKKVAPKMRNTTIVKKSEWVIAFWDGQSGGTKDTLDKARKYHKMLPLVIRPDGAETYYGGEE